MSQINVNARFLISNTDIKKCPEPNKPEYAFIGRSNVGKSSLINMLMGNKNLAKTSSTPGKTQLINHFEVDNHWYLVDLPGYGYAKVSKGHRKAFQKIIEDYILGRENLACVFVLIDSRHKPQKIDMEFMQWLGECQIPFVMVFTKVDKLSSGELKKNLKQYKIEMEKVWEEIPQSFVTSATGKLGRLEVLSFINQTNETLKQHFI